MGTVLSCLLLVAVIWLWVKKGYLKKTIGKRKNGPKLVVPKGFRFDPQPYILFLRDMLGSMISFV